MCSSKPLRGGCTCTRLTLIDLSVTLPTSFLPIPARGFAFVEFGSKQEATAALEATAGIHLYGRRLVVEWAKADDGEGLLQRPGCL